MLKDALSTLILIPFIYLGLFLKKLFIKPSLSWISAYYTIWKSGALSLIVFGDILTQFGKHEQAYLEYRDVIFYLDRALYRLTMSYKDDERKSKIKQAINGIYIKMYNGRVKDSDLLGACDLIVMACSHLNRNIISGNILTLTEAHCLRASLKTAAILRMEDDVEENSVDNNFNNVIPFKRKD